jgi:hypothetical protein
MGEAQRWAAPNQEQYKYVSARNDKPMKRIQTTELETIG